MNHVLRGASAVIAVAALAAGCQASDGESPKLKTTQPLIENKPSSPYQLPAAFDDHSFYWTAEDGIELTTGPAVPVRAFFESWVIVWHQFGADQAYPGYVDATGGHEAFLNKNICALFDCSTARDTPNAVIGTSRFHLVALSSTDRTIHGVLCENEAATIVALRDGDRYSQFPGLMITEFNFARSGSSSTHDARVLQQGARQAPAGDVFDGFQLVKVSGGGGPGDLLFRQYESRCRAGLATPASVNVVNDWIKDPQPTAPEFQPLPQTPGWPEPAGSNGPR